MSTYAFQQHTRDERARLTGLEDTWNTTTMGVLDSLGISSGWHCLEVGAGTGTIAQWMATRAGKTGEITATDLDLRMLEASKTPSLRVIKHDITTDPLPADEFDLIHARFLLSHLPARREIVGRLQRACRPGGWVVVEDFDIGSSPIADSKKVGTNPQHADESLNRMLRALVEIMTAFGFSPNYGREIAADMRSGGLTKVSHSSTTKLICGATTSMEFFRYSMLRFSDQMVESGALSKNEIDHLITLFDDPNFTMTTNPLISTWGRKPFTTC